MGCLEGSGVPVLYIGRTVPKGSGEQGVEMTTHFHLVPSSRMSGAIYVLYPHAFRAYTGTTLPFYH
jgi:hypothetical protein